LSFPAKSAKVEESIDWVVREVKTMPDTVWQLNDNFNVLAIEGILHMLNGESCQELSHLHGLAASSDASIMKDVPDVVGCLRPFIFLRWPTSRP
jgi:hypothetical protein